MLTASKIRSLSSCISRFPGHGAYHSAWLGRHPVCARSSEEKARASSCLSVKQHGPTLRVRHVVSAVQMAMQRVQMCNAIKVLCVFSRPFWPEDFFDLICTGAQSAAV